MRLEPSTVGVVALRVLRFARRVVAAFLRNRGVLLAGGVGYNALLSLVPFLILTVATLSTFVDQQPLLEALRRELAFLLPQHADTLVEAAQTFLSNQAANSLVSVLVLLFSGVYVALPVGRIPRKLAFIGGLCAASLWRGVGILLSYYFATLSMVNLLYGSLATVVVVLLFLEVAFIIVLLGAQVIAELTASAEAGLPWYESPAP